MLKAGTYIAKVASHAIGETKKGNLQAVVSFTVGDQKITYYGSFSDKAKQYTINNLITMGLKGNNPAGDLEIGKEVELVVEIEPDLDRKEQARVKFINQIGAARNVMSQDLAKAKLASLEGAVMSARQSNPKFEDDEKLPF